MQQEEREDKAFDPKKTIFEHLGDEYGWTIYRKGNHSSAVIVGIMMVNGIFSVLHVWLTGKRIRGFVSPGRELMKERSWG